MKHEIKDMYLENNRASDGKKRILTHFIVLKENMPNKGDATRLRSRTQNSVSIPLFPLLF